jgi:hypothetical protein
MFITMDCKDPLLNDPVIDKDEWRDALVHRYVTGQFAGTTVRFSFYFPDLDKYQRRFFENTHQLLTSENPPHFNRLCDRQRRLPHAFNSGAE